MIEIENDGRCTVNNELDLQIVSLKTLYELICLEPEAQLITELQTSGLLTFWQATSDDINDDLHAFLAQTDALVELLSDHLALFVGLGMPLAPPWGSVYLHEENLLLQESTFELTRFMQNKGIVFSLEESQPMDNIGLLLSMLALLMESESSHHDDQGTQNNIRRAISVLLSQHLLPWSSRFCELLIQNARTPLYQLAGLYTRQLLNQVQQHFSIEPVKKTLYY